MDLEVRGTYTLTPSNKQDVGNNYNDILPETLHW